MTNFPSLKDTTWQSFEAFKPRPADLPVWQCNLTADSEPRAGSSQDQAYK